MATWGWFVVMLVGCAAGELGGSDSWLLMVEAGRDGPDRRITPKSVFIAPALASRAEHCRPGFRFDHLGRCVKVVRVDPAAQLSLLLKRLQGAQQASQGSASPPPTHFPSPPASAGPLHFSLPLGTQLPPVHSTTSTEIPPTNAKVLETTPPLPQENTKESEQGTTPSFTLPEELATTLKTPSDDLNLESVVHLEGSGDTTTTSMSTSEGSGFISTEPIEGSGASTILPFEGSGGGMLAVPEDSTEPEERQERSTTTLSEEFNPTEPPTVSLQVFAKPTNCCEESTPIPPTDTTASLLLAVLKGDVWSQNASSKVELETERVKVFTNEAENQTDFVNMVETTTVTPSEEGHEDITEQLPIIEYIDLVLPNTEIVSSETMKEGNMVLIPLENIKWNFSENINRTDHENASKVSKEPLIDRTKVKDSEEVERVEEMGETPSGNENKVVADSWWVETSPLGPSWVRFPEEPPSQRRGPLLDPILSKKEQVRSRPQTNSRFRFPEEAVAPGDRPTILKFWSRIPMLQHDSSDFQGDEDHWVGP